MLYTFKSAASGDLIMLGPQGDQLLRLIGREPASRGIIEVVAMPAVLAALQAASAASAADVPSPEAPDDEATPPPVALRRRLWPVIEMLRRSLAANEPVVWGV